MLASGNPMPVPVPPLPTLSWGRPMLVATLLAHTCGSAATFTVTTTADAGAGSLTQAILDANAAPGRDTIVFDIGAESKTLTPPTTLPEITDAVVLDGTSQPGFTGNPIIELSGTNAPAGAPGLILSTSGSTVRGLVINRWLGSGIEIRGGFGNVVEGCWIGVSLAGTSARGNSLAGILVRESSGNQIGGTTAARRNVISGNRGHGILIHGSTSTSNRIEGNFIGLSPTGTSVIRNEVYGIAIDRAPDTVIGGETAGAGNVISGNSQYGVWIGGPPFGSGDLVAPENTRILGNVIGLDPAGMVSLGNLGDGIHLDAAVGTVIGGTTPAARSVIAGNGGSGISHDGGTFTRGTLIAGNFIGIAASGRVARPNGGSGIVVVSDDGPQIGGTAPGAGNVISGNRLHGIHVARGSIDSFTRIEGNRIGTDPDGTLDLGNSQDGILVEAASGVRIGGSAPGAGNLISGNNGSGIQLTGTAAAGWATGTVIEGNRIGTNADGSVGIPNNAAGVFINARDNAPASGRIGGTAPGQGNLIAFNGLDGVFISGITTGNPVRGNSIHSNGELGINLVGIGVTENDNTDADTGPNGIQNHPLLSGAVLRTAATEIHGTIETLPDATFTLDFYGNDVADASGHGEGRTWLGSVDVTTDPSGFAAFAARVGPTVQRFISATATDADGSTSEFSVTREALDMSAPMDLGDAPDSPDNPRYPTLLAHDGAYHLITDGNLRFGARIDAEPDAIPSDTALGDDANLGLSFPGGSDPDDEDGVRFLAPLVPGTSVPVRIVTGLDGPEPALVQAWIDFNRDFDWSDPGEQVLLNQEVVDGTNTVNVAIPPTALPGTTFARFRLSRTGNLGFTGPASGGEVEDQLVEIPAAGVPLRIGTLPPDGGGMELIWDGDSVLESARSIRGPWNPVPGGTSPFRITSNESDAVFFRLVPR